MPEPIEEVPNFFVLLIGAILGLFIIGGFFYAANTSNLFSSEAATTTIATTIASENSSLSSGLVGHWTFDGGTVDLATTTNSVTDLSGAGNHLNIVSRVCIKESSAVLGRIGQGLHFSGCPTVEGLVRSEVSFQGTAERTISYWVKPSAIGSSMHVVNNGLGSANPSNGWIHYISSTGGLLFRAGYTTTDLLVSTADGTIKADEWQHVAVVFTTSSNASLVKVYVNGVEVSKTTAQNGAGTRETESSTMYLGRSAGGSSPLDGNLDDVRVYNRVISPDEIMRLYKMGEGTKIATTIPDTGTTLTDGLVGHWTFDGDTISGTTVTDASGNGNNGTLTNGPTKAIGKLGQALSFDGTNDYINMGNPTALNDVANLTIATWVWRDGSQSNWAGIVNNSNGDDKGYQLYSYTTSNTLGGYLRNTSGNSGDINTGWLIPDGQWSHVVLTYDGANIRFYGNGNLVNTTAYTHGIGSDLSIFSISRLSSPWKGNIDDTRIYNRALSAEEVQQLYQRGLGATVKICKADSVQDANANTYNTIAIGSQCWLDRNMNVGTRISAATAQTNNATIEKWCYSNSDVNCTNNNPNKPDGGLYQWDEAMQYSTTEGTQGICPDGFHIPTDAEWHTLEKFLKDSGQSCDASRSGAYDCNPAGTKLKPEGTSKFEGNLAGFAISGSSLSRDTYGFFWSSSETDATRAMRRYLDSSVATVYRQPTGSKVSGVSVRCLQD